MIAVGLVFEWHVLRNPCEREIGLLGEIAREANRYGINFLYNQ